MQTSESNDPFFAQPYVDIDERTDEVMKQSYFLIFNNIL